jgi:hypothetical protein
MLLTRGAASTTSRMQATIRVRVEVRMVDEWELCGREFEVQ